MISDSFQHHTLLRMIGRVFTYDKRLHYVIGIDDRACFAQVSTRMAGQNQIIDMPVNEVALRVSGYLRQ